jgi:hypothetical protein
MQELTVKVPAEKACEYKIEIGTDILGSVWSKIESQFGSAGKFVITDANVAKAGHLRQGQIREVLRGDTRHRWLE